jgi:EAL domain-containing protein (putative c-di-GMP-specific phosphodiesterase class I)
MDLHDGRVVGYEALIRWRHPERGMIPPMEFIPIAEETGMIGPIGQWVLRKACSDARHLPDECFVAVNISPVQFMNKDFVAELRAIMAETGIEPRRLEIEVTETVMMQDRERAGAILNELAEIGLSVAVDDFGTGYSNLSYLIDFSFQKLKIDRSFVSRMEGDASSGAVVSTIVGLSRALGVHTIAEGVETENQASLLKAAGCQVVQGYFYGKPAPLALHLAPSEPASTALH